MKIQIRWQTVSQLAIMTLLAAGSGVFYSLESAIGMIIILWVVAVPAYLATWGIERLRVEGAE